MIKNFNGSGLTSAPATLQPPVGKKWKILNGYVNMVDGTGTGTRRVYLFNSLNNSGLGNIVLDTTSVTTVSASFAGFYGPYGSNASIPTTNNADQYVPFLIVTEWDILTWSVTLIAGDTFSFYLVVEETEA